MMGDSEADRLIVELRRMMRNCESMNFELRRENRLLHEAIDTRCTRARRAEIIKLLSQGRRDSRAS